MRNRVLIKKSSFHVDEANKVVVCTLECDMQLEKHPAWDAIDSRMFKKIPHVDWKGRFIIKAKARCNAIDTFNAETGKRIAEGRAKAKMFSISSKVYKLCSDALTKIAKECSKSSVACKQAMVIENDHVLELIK